MSQPVRAVRASSFQIIGILAAARPLIRPLWLSERRDRRLAWLLVLSIAAGLGTAAYADAFELGRGTDRADAVRQIMLVSGGFRSTIGVVFAVVCVLVPIDRLAGMRRDGWCLPLVARGTPPASIVLGATVSLTIGVLGAFSVSYAVFSATMLAMRLADLRSIVTGYAATAPALAAWSSFGILAAVVVRRRNLAVALAAAAIIVPSVLVTIWTVVTGHSPPTWSLLVWAAVAPIPVHVASWRLFAERIRYVACALLVAGLLSRRWVIPND